MTERMPWETEPPKPAQQEYDPTLFVRLRIRHGANVKYVGVPAGDLDITGPVLLDDGSELVISLWGIPSKNEPRMRSDGVMQEIAKYLAGIGRTAV